MKIELCCRRKSSGKKPQITWWKRGSKGYPLRVGSEVGETWLLWDETHLHESKQKSAKCIWEENKMWKAEKDIENNKEGLWECFAFSVIWKSISM